MWCEGPLKLFSKIAQALGRLFNECMKWNSISMKGNQPKVISAAKEHTVCLP